MPARHALYRYEQLLLNSCQENLSDAREDLVELIRRCGPLSENSKQSVEINEEDHGKAILVFTVVTIIFLPLSFVTSYLGMNTSDIRDMDSKQALFWEIAIPLTAVTMGSMLFIAYNGEDIRGRFSTIHRRLVGKQDTSTSARGISVAQRKRASYLQSSSSSTTDYRSLADEAEFLPPRDVWNAIQLGQLHNTMGTERQTRTYIDPSPKALFNRSSPKFLAPDIDTYSYNSRRFGAQRPYSGLRAASIFSPPPPPPPISQGPGVLSGQDLPNPPTYMKINRKFLETDSLAHYGLPWEYDSRDPDYFLILRELAPEETDMLFEHTRRLREGRKGRSTSMRARSGSSYPEVYRDDDIGGMGPPRDYAWVKKGRRSGGRNSSPVRQRIVRI